MKMSHRPGRRAKSRVRPPAGEQTGRLDWSDTAALRALMLRLRVDLDDLISVVEDMQAPRRDRELGPAQHRRIFDECRRNLVAGFEHALPPDSAPPTP